MEDMMKSLYKEIFDLDHQSYLFDVEIIRTKFIELIENHKPYMDDHYMKEIIQNNEKFRQRFFEAYMTSYLVINKCKFQSKNVGPDYNLHNNVYIECVAPTKGTDPNDVPEMYINSIKDEKFVVNSVPEVKIIVRLASAFFDKWKKYTNYIKNGDIEFGCNIIAINDSNIPCSKLEDNIPRIVKMLYGVGHQIVYLDEEKMGVSNRESVQKENKSMINTDFFKTDRYKEISAVIFSSVEFTDLENKIGYDFILIKNPFAIKSVDGLIEILPFTKIYQLNGNQIEIT
jgi:hypothetical protein